MFFKHKGLDSPGLKTLGLEALDVSGIYNIDIEFLA